MLESVQRMFQICVVWLKDYITAFVHTHSIIHTCKYTCMNIATCMYIYTIGSLITVGKHLMQNLCYTVENVSSFQMVLGVGT